VNKDQEHLESVGAGKRHQEGAKAKSDLLGKAGERIEKGLEQGAAFYEEKVKPVAREFARKVSDQFQPDRAAENVERAERWLSRFLGSKWRYLVGVLIFFRPIYIGAPILLLAVFLYFLWRNDALRKTTGKRLLRFTALSLLTAVILRLVLLGLVVLLFLLIPGFITFKII